LESLENLRRQLESLDDLRTIVRTMKAMSAASVRQYERAADALAEYYRSVELALHVVLRDTEPPPALSRRKNEPLRLGAVVFGSDHGLCGRFNEDVATLALEHMDRTAPQRKDRIVLAVGARAAASLEQAGQGLEETFFVPGSAPRITATVQRILLKIDEWREQGAAHTLHLYFNRHLPDGGYRPTRIELLPVRPERFQRLRERAWPSRRLPTYTMAKERLLAMTLRQYLFVSIFRACAESQASEHTSRLSSMQAAERNLDDRHEELRTSFRRARQDAITSELLDVVSGFEALTGGGAG